MQIIFSFVNLHAHLHFSNVQALQYNWISQAVSNFFLCFYSGDQTFQASKRAQKLHKTVKSNIFLISHMKLFVRKRQKFKVIVQLRN